MTQADVEKLRDVLRRLRAQSSDVAEPDNLTGETHPLFACGVEHACDEIDHELVVAECDLALEMTR